MVALCRRILCSPEHRQSQSSNNIGVASATENDWGALGSAAFVDKSACQKNLFGRVGASITGHGLVQILLDTFLLLLHYMIMIQAFCVGGSLSWY